MQKWGISGNIVTSERVLYGGKNSRARVKICYFFSISGIAKLLQSIPISIVF